MILTFFRHLTESITLPEFVNNKGNKLGEWLCNGKGLTLKGFKLKGTDKKGMMYQQKYISVISGASILEILPSKVYF